MQHKKKYIKLEVQLEVIPGKLQMAWPIITVQCLHCDKTSHCAALTIAGATQYFIDNGWNFDGYDAVCREHTPKPVYEVKDE